MGKKVSASKRGLAGMVGQAVYIRSVTHHYIGRLVELVDWGTSLELVLEEVAWVADGERWSELQARGALREVEQYAPGDVSVPYGSVTDISLWHHPMPRTK